VATHTSPEGALQALANDINYRTIHSLQKNYGPNEWASTEKQESSNVSTSTPATGRYRRLPGVALRRLTCAGPGPVRNGQARDLVCHASQNTREYNSADSSRNIEKGVQRRRKMAQHITASDMTSKITVPKGLRKKLTRHAGRPTN